MFSIYFLCHKYEIILFSDVTRWLNLKWLHILWYKPRHDKTNKMSVRPAKTQISLHIRPVWSESLLCPLWVATNPRFLNADSEDSDQTGWMPRLVCLRMALTHFVIFFMSLLIFWLLCKVSPSPRNLILSYIWTGKSLLHVHCKLYEKATSKLLFMNALWEKGLLIVLKEFVV